MQIRKLELHEHGKTRALYEEVFAEDSQPFIDYYYAEKAKDNQIYVAEQDGKICAMFHLNPYTLLVNGSEKEVHYIVAVATRREYRKRGYMAALMRRALKDLYEAGESFTFLMPAAERIYLPHDFRTVYEQQKRYYAPEDVVEDGVKVTEATEDDCARLAKWAGGVLAEQFQVYARRDEAYYQRLLKEYASDGGSLLLYQREGKIVDCKIRISREEEEKSKIMVRIVDVRRMLMAMRLQALIATCFTVTDPVIEENNRCVMLTGTEFSGVMLMDAKPESSEGTITIAALTSLLFGTKTVEEVCRESEVRMSERMKGEMKKLIPLSGIYLNEAV